MKRLFITLLLCSLFNIAKAQLLVGIEGGPSLTGMYGNNVIKKYHKPTLGYSGGLIIQYQFGKTFSICTQLTYENKGSKTHVDISNSDETVKGYVDMHFNYNYLMMPLLFRSGFGNKARFFVNAGPMFGYLLFQQTTTVSNVIKIDDQYPTNGFKRWDMGISSGIGISYPIFKPLIISLELRNNTGLKSLNRYKIEDNGKVKTFSNNLLIGIVYKISNSH